MIDKLEKYKKIVTIISFFIGGFCGVFLTMHNYLNTFDDTLATIETTQQMALKSVIWNEEIPLGERASACDTYLSAGYNSLTKKECETIIENGVREGIFSYVESER